MKLSSLQENLKQGLYIVSHVAGKNINLPILNNILVEVRESSIKLITTNLEIGIVHTVRGKVEEEGSFTVDSKIFTDYINLLPNKKVNIIKKENELIIECDNYKTKVKGQDAEDFPLIPKVEKAQTYKVNIAEFKKAISQVVFAVSTSEARLELSGVFFSFIGNKLSMAATDSYRLAEKGVEIKKNDKNKDEEERKIIIPARTLQEVLRILSGLKENGEEDKEIEISVSDNQILFTIGSTELVSRLIEGQYPDYKQIIPTTSKTTISINKRELIRAVKASSLFSKTGINDVNLDFPAGKNQVIISSTSGQTGESVIELNADVKGEDNSAVVNYRYLLDGLNNIEDENIKIEVVDNNTPCIIRPEKNNGYLYIIMPIKQ
jgi:DNA polymerase-3 subunit beta